MSKGERPRVGSAGRPPAGGRGGLPPFQRLLDRDGPAVHRYLVAMTGPDAADDCFQEAVVAALRAYPALTDTRNLRGWIFTIAHRKALDHHRRQARAARPMAELPAGPPSESDPLADDGLWEAVRALPDKQRAAVVLRYVADLPYREIGRIVHCSESAARQNVRAGLHHLREVIA